MRSDRSTPRQTALRLGEPVDGRFIQPTLIVRWTTTTVAVAAATFGSGTAYAGTLGLWALLIVSNTVVRTVWPIATAGRRRLVELAAECAVICIAVSATGGFESPFSFTLIPPIAITAFGHGAVPALVAALASATAIGIPMLLPAGRAPDSGRLVLQWTTELLLVGVVASYAHRVVRESFEQHRTDRDAVERLSDANQLLVTLHEVTQDMPATLDLDDALESVFGRVRSLVPVNYGGIALRDDAGDDWRFVAHLGPVDPMPGAESRLAAVREQLSTCVLTRSRPDQLLYPHMSDGRYVALRARGELIGVLVVEHNTPRLYDRHHDEALVLVAEAAALAIDNARLFGRLRHLGASEERTRIARDLHDRMGQSLAYMGFELDRIVRAADDTLVREDLLRLREYLRELTGEIRETLYDLRSDTDDEQTARQVLDEFGARVSARSGLSVSVEIDALVDLAPIRERELCRITKEALVNAERHSHGAHVSVHWGATSEGVVAEVRDDGRGIDIDAARDDSYGLVGMRERAAAIGAEISVDSSRTDGTVVRVTVPHDVSREARRVPA